MTGHNDYDAKNNRLKLIGDVSFYQRSKTTNMPTVIKQLK